MRMTVEIDGLRRLWFGLLLLFAGSLLLWLKRLVVLEGDFLERVWSRPAKNKEGLVGMKGGLSWDGGGEGLCCMVWLSRPKRDSLFDLFSLGFVHRLRGGIFLHRSRFRHHP